MLTTHSAGAPLVGAPGVTIGSGAGADDAQPDPAPAQDATTLALGLATPHAVVDALGQGILEALVSHVALGADALGFLDADSVAREEDGR
jgi:hypothetical protein